MVQQAPVAAVLKDGNNAAAYTNVNTDALRVNGS